MPGKNKQVNIKYLALNAIYSNLLSASKEMKKEIYARVYANKDKSNLKRKHVYEMYLQQEKKIIPISMKKQIR